KPELARARPCSSERLKTIATGTGPRRVRALPMSTLPAERRFSGARRMARREEAVARAGGVEDRPVLNYAARPLWVVSIRERRATQRPVSLGRHAGRHRDRPASAAARASRAPDHDRPGPHRRSQSWRATNSRSSMVTTTALLSAGARDPDVQRGTGAVSRRVDPARR